MLKEFMYGVGLGFISAVISYIITAFAYTKILFFIYDKNSYIIYTLVTFIIFLIVVVITKEVRFKK